MQDKPDSRHDAVYQRMAELFRSIPPGEDRVEKFLAKLHGPDWQQRAVAADPPPILVNALRLLDMDKRLRRIETHLGMDTLPG
jgi:hypothetical protein